MRDVLEVADVLACIQVHGHERVGVEVVARTDRAVEVGRGVADDEVDAVRRLVHGRILPHAAAEGLVRVAVFGEGVFLRGDVAVLVPPGRVRCRPDTDRVFRDRIEGPQELPVVGVVGFDEAADAVFAAVGADENLPLTAVGAIVSL